MPTVDLTTLATSILATFGIVLGARLTGGWNVRAKRLEVTTPPYDKMVERLNDIEAQLDEERQRRRELEDRMDADRGWIKRTISRVLDHDPELAPLLKPWPTWVPTVPPTLD